MKCPHFTLTVSPDDATVSETSSKVQWIRVGSDVPISGGIITTCVLDFCVTSPIRGACCGLSNYTLVAEPTCECDLDGQCTYVNNQLSFFCGAAANDPEFATSAVS